MAFGLHTLPRATYDLDVLVAPSPVVEAELRRRFVVAEDAKDVYFDQRALILEVPASIMPTGVFFATHGLPRRALAGRIEVPTGLPAGVLPVATPEDLLLLKAVVAAHPARPPGKRATDRLDLRMLVSASPALDLAYLERAAARAGVGHVLAEAGLDLWRAQRSRAFPPRSAFHSMVTGS